MGIVSPDFGLIFWMTLSFLMVLFILKKYAWKPILKSLKARADSIGEALHAAERTKDEMARIKSDNEKIMQEAREEREKMLREARDVKERILADAKIIAKSEADKLIGSARTQIESEKLSAINEIKEKVVNLSIEIAEKILKESLDNDKKQKSYVDSLIKEIHMN
jgi:F-type H+-transporting ATPase subunit b